MYKTGPTYVLQLNIVKNLIKKLRVPPIIRKAKNTLFVLSQTLEERASIKKRIKSHSAFCFWPSYIPTAIHITQDD